LFLVILDYRREAWDAHERGVIVLQHTVARIFQRTLNHAELRAVGEVLYEHISNALQYCNKQEDPTTFRTVTTEGVVIWKRDEENDLFAKTWISRETAIEPDLIEAMDAVANSGCIVLP
jgi:hypothetical protein